MTDSSQRPLRVVAGVALAVVILLAAAAVFRSGDAGRRPPSVDLSQVEPAVAKGLADARDAVSDAPDSVEAWSQLAMTYDAHEYTVEAISCYREASRLAPKDPRWPYLLGHLFYATDRALSLREFEVACRLAPHSSLYHNRAAEAYLDVADLARAQEHLEAALESDSNNPRSLFRLAQLEMLRGRFAEALKLGSVALDSAPGHRAILQFLVAVHGRLDSSNANEYRGRLQADTSLTDGWPDPVRSQVQLFRLDSWWLAGQGESRLEIGDVSGSIALLRKAVEQSPANVVFRVRLANVYLRSGQYNEARQVIDNASEEQRLHFDMVRARATLALLSEEWRTAEQHLRLAMRQKNDSAALRSDLGFSLRQQGLHTEAIQEFERSLDLDPNSLTTWKQLVETLVESGNREQAQHAVDQALKHFPNDADLLAL